MNCIIIEDGEVAAERLEHLLKLSGYNVEVLAKIDSVEEAVTWLKNNKTDLIFLDVQLGDGLGFEIFDYVNVTTPVIFTTSYDQYITRAFEVNSLSYLIKPIGLENLKDALHKYSFLYKNSVNINQKVLSLNNQYQQRFLVRDGNLSKPIMADEVAWFYIKNKHFLFLTTKAGNQYLYDSTLDILEQRLNPDQFFRINRSYIVRFDIVKHVGGYDASRRIKIDTLLSNKDEEMLVSRHRVIEFKAWLDR